IDGRSAEIDDLERRIGAGAAAPVRALLELDPDELGQLFGLAAPAAPADENDVDALRDRLDRDMEARRAEIERRQDEIRQRIERDMGRHVDEATRRHQEILEREIERATRRATRRDSDARVVMGRPVHVHKDESTGDVVSIGGGVTVDGEVLGDAVSVGGSEHITGVVSGNAVSVGGSVHLGPQAKVMGDVVSVGGTVERAPGAEVMGQVTEVSLWQGMAGGWFGAGFPKWTRELGPPDYFDGALLRFIRCLVFVLVLMLLGALAATIARHPLERASAAASDEPWKAGVVGILAVILFVPAIFIVLVLLAVSIIGIPLLLLWPFAVIGCVFAAFFGYLAAAHALARWSEGRFGWKLRGPVTAMVLGLFLLHVPWVMARLVDVVDSARDVGGFLRLMLLLFWMLVNLCAGFVGIGAMILARKRGPAPALPVVAPPPPYVPPSGGPHSYEAPAIATAAPPASASTVEPGWDEPFEDFDEPATATSATVVTAEPGVDDSLADGDPREF
ncbi:MAG TPA: hypothetical protein VN923_19295, partial [Thermoanaerobaculia bacterium]|nr:hypothetical protein [Thermoanaerobaculia bacterium]